MKIFAFLATLFVVLSLPATAIEKVTVAGSSTVLPLGESEAEAYNLQQRDYQISVTGGGTGAGITGIGEGRLDIAMASREVTTDEITKYGENFQEFLIGYDGIVIVISPQIYDSGVTDLSKEQIKGIYNGETKNWKKLGGPDAEIYVIAREQGSGTRDTFNEDIMGDKKAETPGVITTALGSAEVKTAVAGSDKGIGYLGFSYAEGGNVRPISLDGTLPTAESIRDGTYELSRKLYFYTLGEPRTGAKAFIDYVVSPEGQMIAEENGFIPVSTVSKSDIKPTSGTEEPVSQAKSQPGFETVLSVVGLLAVLSLRLIFRR